MHSQHIIDKATKEFLLPLKNTRTILGILGHPEFTSQVALSALLFQSVMVQLTISLPT